MVTEDAVREIIACADRTLAAPSARMTFGHEWQNLPSAGQLGPAARLFGAAARAVLRRIAPDQDLRRAEAVGYAEPAAGRYMIDHGGLSEICDGGTTFTGLSGRPLADLRPSATDRDSGGALGLLRLVPGATGAHFEAAETLRGTACRRFTVRVDTARAAAASPVGFRMPRGVTPELAPLLALTVWTGGQYVRQIRFRDEGAGASPGPAEPGPHGAGISGAGISKVLTLELWDFGVPTGHLDWSRLPSFPDSGSAR